MKKIFIEPNLKSVSGHVFEAMKAIYQHYESHADEVGFVCHISVEDQVKKYLPSILPLYIKSCFETGETTEVIYNIKTIIENIQLRSQDLIIFTTAHLRDIEAVNAIVRSKMTPRFIMQLHQYYPPMLNADMISDIQMNLDLDQRYKRVFNHINKDRVEIVVTPVYELSKKIYEVTKYKARLCPVPFSPSAYNNIDSSDCVINKTIGFFGDGRKEKGLLDFLRFIKISVDDPEQKNFRFIVQIQNPRGFSDSELLEIDSLRKELSYRKSVEILIGPIDSKLYYEKLSSCAVICIMHHPDHYSIRLSGIAVECGIIGTPIIAREKTSVGQWILNGKIYGKIFDKDGSKLKDLLLEITRESENLDVRNIINQFRGFFISEYSAKNYINKLEFHKII